jgi:hypothetical protein
MSFLNFSGKCIPDHNPITSLCSSQIFVQNYSTKTQSGMFSLFTPDLQILDALRNPRRQRDATKSITYPESTLATCSYFLMSLSSPLKSPAYPGLLSIPPSSLLSLSPSVLVQTMCDKSYQSQIKC